MGRQRSSPLIDKEIYEMRAIYNAICQEIIDEYLMSRLGSEYYMLQFNNAIPRRRLCFLLSASAVHRQNDCDIEQKRILWALDWDDDRNLIDEVVNALPSGCLCA